jgi:hypothetical protein
MKTLVIHPEDETTDFLSEIYSDKNWTVIRDNVSKKLLKESIKSHDRIVMLGHGTEGGLFGHKNRFVINPSMVYLLRDKLCVCIWCNADVFFEKYNLKGFYTGMIISELEEAIMYCVDTSMQDIDLSNESFSMAIKESIDEVDMLKNVNKLYNNVNAVTDFNKNNLYYK